MQHNEIALDPSLEQAVREGRKRATIRKGVRPYGVGPGKIGDIPIEITRVQVFKLAAVPERVARIDGFISKSHMIEGIREYYPDIDPLDEVTVVEFYVRDE
jgi:hypothetical protein